MNAQSAIAIARETTAVDVVDQADVPVTMTSLSPRQMAYQLIARGADLSVVKEFIAMNRELADEEARKAFIAARAAAKAEIPIIAKNKHVGFESKKAGASSTDYWHEDLAEIVATIDPILSKHGLSYEFVPQQSGSSLTITCILSHEAGHSRSYPMTGPNDQSGNKNAIQAAGSTATYLSRYTLKMALGLAASKDDDGSSAEAPTVDVISEQQVIDIRDLIEATAEPGKVKAFTAEFLKWAKADSLADIPAAKYAACVTAIKASRAA